MRAEAQPFAGNKMAKRKHQIGTLNHQAKVKELEILEGKVRGPLCCLPREGAESRSKEGEEGRPWLAERQHGYSLRAHTAPSLFGPLRRWRARVSLRRGSRQCAGTAGTRSTYSSFPGANSATSTQGLLALVLPLSSPTCGVLPGSLPQVNGMKTKSETKAKYGW